MARSASVARRKKVVKCDVRSYVKILYIENRNDYYYQVIYISFPHYPQFPHIQILNKKFTSTKPHISIKSIIVIIPNLQTDQQSTFYSGTLCSQQPFLSRSAFIKFLIYSALFTLFSEIYLSNLSNSDNSFGVQRIATLLHCELYFLTAFNCDSLVSDNMIPSFNYFIFSTLHNKLLHLLCNITICQYAA